jgi:hypothetical protein
MLANKLDEEEQSWIPYFMGETNSTARKQEG